MPTIVTNCSNNYGPYQFPEKLIPLFINNIRHRKPLPVYGKGENVRDWLYVVDHARAIDLIFHKGTIAETYNIGGFNEWKNIDIIKTVIKTVDRLLGRPEGADLDLITYVTDRAGTGISYQRTPPSCGKFVRERWPTGVWYSSWRKTHTERLWIAFSTLVAGSSIPALVWAS